MLKGNAANIYVCMDVIPVSAVLFFSKLSSVPGGRAAKAWSVGANTVNGPGPKTFKTLFIAIYVC